MNDMTLKQIEMFVTVAESLSYSEAARTLFVDPSVVSRSIQRLEENFGTALFVRHNKGVMLTADGEFLYNAMKPVHTRLDKAVSFLKSHGRGDRDSFKIGCLEGKETISAFEDSVFQFRKLYPNVQLNVTLYSFDELRREFVNESLDFAVSYYMGFGDYRETSHLILKEKPSYFVVSKDSPAVMDGRLRVEALRDEILFLIAPAEISPAEDYILGLCGEQGFRPKKIRYMPNVLAIEIAVKNNKGFTIGSDMFGDHFPDTLRLFRIPGTRLSESIAVFWHNSTAEGFAGRFIETLVML